MYFFYLSLHYSLQDSCFLFSLDHGQYCVLTPLYKARSVAVVFYTVLSDFPPTWVFIPSNMSVHSYFSPWKCFMNWSCCLLSVHSQCSEPAQTEMQQLWFCSRAAQLCSTGCELSGCNIMRTLGSCNKAVWLGINLQLKEKLHEMYFLWAGSSV